MKLSYMPLLSSPHTVTGPYLLTAIAMHVAQPAAEPGNGFDATATASIMNVLFLYFRSY
jgi:hypothetical protein